MTPSKFCKGEGIETHFIQNFVCEIPAPCPMLRTHHVYTVMSVLTWFLLTVSLMCLYIYAGVGFCDTY